MQHTQSICDYFSISENLYSELIDTLKVNSKRSFQQYFYLFWLSKQHLNSVLQNTISFNSFLLNFKVLITEKNPKRDRQCTQIFRSHFNTHLAIGPNFTYTKCIKGNLECTATLFYIMLYNHNLVCYKLFLLKRKINKIRSY